MKKYLSVLVSLFFFSQCQSSSQGNWDTQIFEALQKLEAGKTMVDIKIDQKDFYPNKPSFNGTVTLNDSLLAISFQNQEGSKVLISIEESHWHNSESKKIYLKDGLAEGNSMNGSFLINHTNSENYTLKEGIFEIIQLNNEACIMTVKGVAKNSLGDLPLEGIIVWKKPASLNSEKEALFFN